MVVSVGLFQWNLEKVDVISICLICFSMVHMYLIWDFTGPNLGNMHKTNWKDPPCSMGKLTISTGPFSIAMLNYQRVIRWCFLGQYISIDISERTTHTQLVRFL